MIHARMNEFCTTLMVLISLFFCLRLCVADAGTSIKMMTNANKAKWRKITHTLTEKQQKFRIWMRMSAADDRGNDIKPNECVYNASPPLSMVFNVCRANKWLENETHNKCCNHSIWMIWMNSILSFNSILLFLGPIVCLCRPTVSIKHLNRWINVIMKTTFRQLYELISRFWWSKTTFEL